MGGNPWRKWLGESDEPGRNRLQAFVYSRLWMGDDEEDEVEDSTGKASWIDKVKLAVCCLALVAIFAYPSIERVLSGERTILEGCVELTGKCLVIVCLFVPVYIRLKRKSRGCLK